MPSSSSFIETRLLLPAAQADGGHGLTHRESHLQANAEEAQDDISKHISHHNSIQFINSSISQFSEKATMTKNIRQLLLLNYRWTNKFLTICLLFFLRKVKHLQCNSATQHYIRPDHTNRRKAFVIAESADCFSSCPSQLMHPCILQQFFCYNFWIICSYMPNYFSCKSLHGNNSQSIVSELQKK